jgi:hypothetical protein
MKLIAVVAIGLSSLVGVRAHAQETATLAQQARNPLTDVTNLITRTIAPIITQPPQAEGESWTSGVGDIQFSAFLSPTHIGEWTWGIGSAVLVPSASHELLGQGKWAIGPTAAALKYDGPWTYGALISNVWSVAGDARRSSVNQMQLEPLLSYSFPNNPDR